MSNFYVFIDYAALEKFRALLHLRRIKKNIWGEAKVIARCYFAVIFLMKNFGSACEISLFNPLEFHQAEKMSKSN